MSAFLGGYSKAYPVASATIQTSVSQEILATFKDNNEDKNNFLLPQDNIIDSYTADEPQASREAQRNEYDAMNK